MKKGIENILQDVLTRIKKSDRGLWFSSFALMVISLLLIYSTTDILGNPLRNVFVHFIFFLAAYFIMVVLHFIHYDFFRKFARYAPFLIIILLIALFAFGITINGAKRWIRIVGFTFQPSEFIKMLLVLYVARTLAIFQREKGCNDIAFRRIFVVTGIACLGIAVSNFSTAVLMGVTVFIMMAIGRIRTKLLSYLLLGVGGFVGLIVLLAVGTSYRPPIGRLTTALNRIERFAAPERAAQREAADFAKLKTKQERESALQRKSRRENEKQQVEAAKAAIATGGFIGKGPGNSDAHYVLPLPYSDYIFAIIIEEFGLLVGGILLFIYCALVFRASAITKRCTRTFPALLVIGLTTIIVLQAFMNMAVAVSLMPVTGQPLPFVSKGGTSILVTGTAIGMILSVTYWLKRSEEERK